jgi:hypothetical protein
MADPGPRQELQEIADIRDPDVRRALRAMYHELATTVQRHQLEIEAMLQIILEKHVAHMSEYKLHLSRLQLGQKQRDQRIHDQLSGAARPAASSSAPAAEEPGGRYRLDG